MPNTFGYTPWSPSQIDFMRKNYAKYGQAYCAAHLHKSENAIRCKARKMKIRSQEDDSWTEKEVETLKACWMHTSFREMLEALKPRTPLALKRKAAKLKLGARLQGMINGDQGCRLLGVCRPEFNRIVALGNVHTLRDRSARIMRYDRDQVIQAGKDYFRRETAKQAAARIGWNYEKLRTAAARFGATRVADEYKMYPEEWDALSKKWEEHVRRCRASAAKRVLANFHAKTAEQARKILEEAGYYVSPAPCIAPALSIQDTGNALSTN